VSDLGTDTLDSWNCFFHCPPGSAKQTIWPAILVSEEFSSLRHSPSLEQLNKAKTLLPLPQGEDNSTITTPRRYPNINGFPSSCNAVGITLRTDLLLVDDALPGKPCPCDDQDSHPTTLLLPPGSALENGPQDLTTLLLPNLYAQLPQTSKNLLSKVSALGLSPVHFRGP
jgi:hypothetical protein